MSKVELTREQKLEALAAIGWVYSELTDEELKALPDIPYQRFQYQLSRSNGGYITSSTSTSIIHKVYDMEFPPDDDEDDDEDGDHYDPW